MVDSAIEARALRVVRDGVEVLRGLDFDVAPGRITGLLGPSGCGKTTLMRVIVGTQRITSGEVHVRGRGAGDPALRRVIGYSSQAASVYDDLTVVENLRFFAAATGTTRADVGRVLQEVDLERFAHRLTGRLSGGQRSRVSLAVAMLGRPAVLVLDEPTVGLDPVLRVDLWSLFHRLAAQGATLLVSSHVMDEAERCDDLLLMREGRLLAHDTPQGVKERTGTESLEDAFLRLVVGEDAA